MPLSWGHGIADTFDLCAMRCPVYGNALIIFKRFFSAAPPQVLLPLLPGIANWPLCRALYVKDYSQVNLELWQSLALWYRALSRCIGISTGMHH